MRALSHVEGLVRVSLPKRAHQPLLFPLLKFPSYSMIKKAYVASCNQEIVRVRSQCLPPPLGTVRTESAVYWCLGQLVRAI
jgi:hypothetical protein